MSYSKEFDKVTATFTEAIKGRDWWKTWLSGYEKACQECNVNGGPLHEWIPPLYKKGNFPEPEKPFLYKLIDDLDDLDEPQVKVNQDIAIPDLFKKPHLDSFFIMAKYACGDADRFSGHIKEGPYYNTCQVLNRLWRNRSDVKNYGKPTEAAKAAAPGDRAVNNDLNFFLGTSQTVLSNTKKAFAGICTTFGWAAGSLLISDMWTTMAKKDPGILKVNRIEVVGWLAGHVFVIVNREGDPPEKKGLLLPPKDKWGEGAIIVDVWLGTLGNDYIFAAAKGCSNKDNDCFLKGDIISLFDSKTFSWK